MPERENILVTGGAGFIGSHLVSDLLESGEYDVVVAVDNLSMATGDNLEPHLKNPALSLYRADVRSHEDIGRIMTDHSIDTVCHLATGILVDSLRDPSGVASNIYGMQLNLLDLLKEGAFGKLISFSTSEVYGSSDGLVLDEESLLKPQTTYAAAKASADMLTASYAESFDEVRGNTTIIRPFNNYGPGKRVRKGGGIIPQTIAAFSEGRPVHLSGGGEAQREFVYVKDTVAAVRAVLAKPEKTADELYVVSSGQPRKMKDIVKDIARLMGVKENVEVTEPRPGDVSFLEGNGSKIKDQLGFEPTTAWDDGLLECIKFYTQNPDLVGR